MKSAALITGATGGIGLEFAKLFAKRKTPLILVARNADRLRRISKYFQEELHVPVLTISQDLSAFGAAETVYEAVRSAGWEVEYLVNNAGFGDWTRFSESDWKKQSDMISLNVLTLTGLCRFFSQDMCARKSGRILNVASVAAFMPGPYMSVYYATKAYVRSFSIALAEELQSSGVSVTVLCPAPTATNFEKTANLTDGSPLFQRLKPVSPRRCAVYGYHAMMCGQTVACHTLAANLIRLGCKLVPAKFAAKQAAKSNGIPKTPPQRTLRRRSH